jgi:hypothetical protein
VTGMKRCRHFLGLLLTLMGGSSCQREAAQRAFYHWRTGFHSSPAEREALVQQHVGRLYLHVFDVAWDARTSAALPEGEVSFAEAVPSTLDVAPVVYVANGALEHSADPAELAQRVWARTLGIAAAAGFSFHELQIDCDWTDATREAYFALCRTLRALSAAAGVELSATIRLHQVKYRQRTGVPPVDRGMLMFYNVGHLGPDPERSSIFNEEDASRYVESIDSYPLPLDAVLPIFSWAIHGRGASVVGLIDKPDFDALGAAPGIQRVDARHAIVQSAGFRGGNYFREGDTLTMEAMTPERAQAAGALLAAHFHPAHSHSIALFDLDERNLRAYSPQNLDHLFSLSR